MSDTCQCGLRHLCGMNVSVVALICSISLVTLEHCSRSISVDVFHRCGQRFWCLRRTAHQLQHGFPVFCRTSQHVNDQVVPISCTIIEYQGKKTDRLVQANCECLVYCCQLNPDQVLLTLGCVVLFESVMWGTLKPIAYHHLAQDVHLSHDDSTSGNPTISFPIITFTTCLITLSRLKNATFFETHRYMALHKALEYVFHRPLHWSSHYSTVGYVPTK